MLLDHLLVILGILELFTRRRIAQVVPADEELRWVLVASLLEPSNLILAKELETKNSQEFIDVDLPEATAERVQLLITPRHVFRDDIGNPEVAGNESDRTR